MELLLSSLAVQAVYIPLAIALGWAFLARLFGAHYPTTYHLGAAAGVFYTYYEILGLPSLDPKTALSRVIVVPAVAIVVALVTVLMKPGPAFVRVLTVALVVAGSVWTVWPAVIGFDVWAILSIIAVGLFAWAAFDALNKLQPAPASASTILFGIAMSGVLLALVTSNTATAQLQLALTAGVFGVFWLGLVLSGIAWTPIASLTLLPTPLALLASQVVYGGVPLWGLLPIALIPAIMLGFAGSLGGRGPIARVALTIRPALMLLAAVIVACSAMGVIELPGVVLNLLNL